MLKTLPLICLALCLWGCPPPWYDGTNSLLDIEIASPYPSVFLAVAEIDGTPLETTFQNFDVSPGEEITTEFRKYAIHTYIKDKGELKIWAITSGVKDSLFLLSETVKNDGTLYVYALIGKDIRESWESRDSNPPQWEGAQKLYWQSIQDTVWVYHYWGRAPGIG